MVDPLKSNIPRCIHGVFDAESDGPNRECSVCTPIEIHDVAQLKTLLVPDKKGGWRNLKVI